MLFIYNNFKTKKKESNEKITEWITVDIKQS